MGQLFENISFSKSKHSVAAISVKQMVNIHATESRTACICNLEAQEAYWGPITGVWVKNFASVSSFVGNVESCCFDQVERQIRVPNFAAPDPPESSTDATQTFAKLPAHEYHTDAHSVRTLWVWDNPQCQ